MPCDYKQYPDNWKWLSRQIVADAGNKCELCHAPNGAFIQRIKDAEYPWYKIENTKPEDKFTKVVLTVHHINHDKKDSTKQNLIALCQKCHLRLDLAHHMKNRRAARRNTEEANLQLTFGFISSKDAIKVWNRRADDNRDCDTCDHDGSCTQMVIKCKGYSPTMPDRREE